MKPFILLALLLGPTLLHANDKTIVFLGDSLTAGYGLDEEEAFPQRIQSYLERDGLRWNVVNAGISGDTTTGGLKRLDWVLRSSPTVVFLALGANDGLRGVDPKVTRKNLDEIIARLRRKRVRVILAGMQIPTSYGETYTSDFRGIFPALAKKHSIPIYPFLLEGVAMQRELNLPDGIHPNEKGQSVIAERVYKFIKPHLSRS